MFPYYMSLVKVMCFGGKISQLKSAPIALQYTAETIKLRLNQFAIHAMFDFWSL